MLVVTPDDVVESRDIAKAAPRDNVIWEHGFFTGGLGRERVFIVKPRGAGLKLPSNLLGITSLSMTRTVPRRSTGEARAGSKWRP